MSAGTPVAFESAPIASTGCWASRIATLLLVAEDLVKTREPAKARAGSWAHGPGGTPLGASGTSFTGGSFSTCPGVKLSRAVHER